MWNKAFLTLLVAASVPVPVAVGALQAPADGSEPRSDSLEARVWLDRGEEPVVQVGDEVRVYYRTSDDAFAAIFRIDTDGEISLVFPQHPDVDPYVGGGRDYRLLFPDSPRWQVREDPGMGYYFMIASPVPLDFSAFGFDSEEGWDLSGIAGTVYEDPYVAIDDYVAIILPTWESTAYALDFLSYSVGERREYPRFLCYDCHEFRSYSTWNPYSVQCSSYQVVIWRDPYFVPRYRYRGTRVVFTRPFGPRPRYGVTARVAGRPLGPVVRSRAAPPPRAATFKEPARSTPLRRPSAIVPDRRFGAARSTPLQRAPTRAATGAGSSSDDRSRPTLQRRPPSQRLSGPPRTGAPRNGAAPSRVPPGRERPIVRTPPGGTSPGARLRAVPHRSGSPASARPPARFPARPPAAGSGRAGPAARPSARPPAARPPAARPPAARPPAARPPSARPSASRPSPARPPAAKPAPARRGGSVRRPGGAEG